VINETNMIISSQVFVHFPDGSKRISGHVIYYFCALFWQGVTVCLDAMSRAFPATNSLQKTLKLFYSPLFRQSEAGIPIGPNSSTPASSRHMLHLYTTPAPVYQVGNG